MKAFDKDGNEIDVFSQEELDAKIKETIDAQAAADADAKAKADADAAAAAAAAAASKNDEVPEWAKQIIAKVENLSTNHTMSYIDKVTGGVDSDKKKAISEKFNSLSGYDETPEGMARRAEDAYLLATGEKFNANVVNINNLAAAGGGRTQTDVKAVTEADKAVQSALGITPADVEKFGKK